MSDTLYLVLMNTSPDALRRAERVAFAADLLKRNISEREVRKRVARRWECSKWTALRTVEVARDSVFI